MGKREELKIDDDGRRRVEHGDGDNEATDKSQSEDDTTNTSNTPESLGRAAAAAGLPSAP